MANVNVCVALKPGYGRLVVQQTSMCNGFNTCFVIHMYLLFYNICIYIQIKLNPGFLETFLQ